MEVGVELALAAGTAASTAAAAGLAGATEHLSRLRIQRKLKAEMPLPEPGICNLGILCFSYICYLHSYLHIINY